MSVLTPAELRDLAKLDSLAHQVLIQTGHLRRNMIDHDTADRIRYSLIWSLINDMDDVITRCERRADKLKKKQTESEVEQ